MELDKQTKSKVWWNGAITNAIKGIPQGLLLGALASFVMLGCIYGLGALAMPAAVDLAYGFGSFLFTNGISATATTLPAIGLGNFFAVFNPVPVIFLNTVLTAIGNFLTGGDIAVNKYQQEVDHAKNEGRIREIEGRERQFEQVVTNHLNEHRTAHAPRHVQQILEEGPRVRVDKEARVEQKAASHAADVVAGRLEDAERVIH